MCIGKLDARCKFKLHTVYIEDLDSRHRLNKMITVIDNTAVFAAEVRYHKSYWKNYTRPVGLLCNDHQSSHMYNVEILQVKRIFSKNVKICLLVYSVFIIQ